MLVKPERILLSGVCYKIYLPVPLFSSVAQCFCDSLYHQFFSRKVSGVNHSHADEGEDLGAYLIQQGWAMALPDAPSSSMTVTLTLYAPAASEI